MSCFRTYLSHTRSPSSILQPQFCFPVHTESHMQAYFNTPVMTFQLVSSFLGAVALFMFGYLLFRSSSSLIYIFRHLNNTKDPLPPAHRRHFLPSIPHFAPLSFQLSSMNHVIPLLFFTVQQDGTRLFTEVENLQLHYIIKQQ